MHSIRIFRDHPRWDELVSIGVVSEMPVLSIDPGKFKEYQNATLPSTTTQMTNAAKAIGRVASNLVQGKSVKTPITKVIERLQTCLTCEFLVDQTRCGKCGCMLLAKAGLETEKCPEGKW